MTLHKATSALALSVLVSSGLIDAKPLHAPKLDTRGSCPTGFLNVVYNGDSDQNPAWPTGFANLQTIGVTDWIGFTLYADGKADSNLNANQQKMIKTLDSEIADAQALIQDPNNAPPYLQYLNEPDIGAYGQPVISPDDAAGNFSASFGGISTTTTWLSPPPAIPYSDWLVQFFASAGCQGVCDEKIPIILSHIYSLDANDAINQISNIHNQFPSKRIWISETAPTSNPADTSCTFQESDMINWMNTVIGFARDSGYVDKVFWNQGEYSVPQASNPAQCNPSLTNEDGSLNDLGNNFGTICA